MLLPEELEALRDARRAGDGTLTRFLATLDRRAGPVLAGAPPVPEVKALLSRDGGICPADRAALRFDPWEPRRHTCPRCGRVADGERHHRHWARAQHLWLAERAADLALLAAIREDGAAAAKAAALLAGYEERYFALPNRDNVLGPSHLFFSTYLESLWINSYLAAAITLRQAGLLPDPRIDGINRLADEAATLIAEFNEGLSNRQTWHAAALAAIAVWFDDAELLGTAVESRTGLVGHLADGFGEDGLWWEGENYHLFALRGLIQGLRWARVMEFDLLEDPDVRAHFRAALLAPARSALPDFTYPARGDSRRGVSLAHPAFLELWEMGRLWLEADDELEGWLSALYRIGAPPLGDTYDAWVHDAGLDGPERRERTDLSWWVTPAMLLGPSREVAWEPRSVLFHDQGLAVLREPGGYASLECGPRVAGHGHPDRLHLTLHSGAVHWLPDPGTGSYVEETLHWYRSALAHNAPVLDGENAGGGDAWCAAFDSGEQYRWCRGRAGPLTRTIIAGPGHLVDLLELRDDTERELLLPWHFQGELRLEPEGNWQSAALDHPFLSAVESDQGNRDTVRRVRVTAAEGISLRAQVLAPGAELLRARTPPLPGESGTGTLLAVRARGRSARWVTVLDWSPSGSSEAVTALAADPEAIQVTQGDAITRYISGDEGLRIEAGGRTVRLEGLRPAPRSHRPLFQPRSEPEAQALAPRILEPPRLDGSLDGFDPGAPLALDEEHQYRRSEEPFDPERISAVAWVNWDGDALYLAVQVRKPEVILRPADAPPENLDNQPEDLNSDGLQVYLRQDTESVAVLILPEAGGGLRSRPIGPDRGAQVTGAWVPTAEGYTVTLGLSHELVQRSWSGARLRFDLLINEMRPGRVRRAGQLVWSGGNGWIYLRGDRQDPEAMGILELG